MSLRLWNLCRIELDLVMEVAGIDAGVPHGILFPDVDCSEQLL